MTKLSHSKRLLTRTALPLFTCAVMTSALVGCDADDTVFAPNCPVVEIPAAAADYYDYNGNSPDLAHLRVRASMMKLTGECLDAPKQVGIRNRISVAMHVTRGPGTSGNPIELPYFVAVVHNGKIIDKKIFSHTVTFPPNIYQTDSATRIVSIDLPASAKRDALGYRLEIGFQLSENQLSYNRTHLVPASFIHKE